MSSGGKSLVPFGGLTSIFWTSSANGGGASAPVLPPPRSVWDWAEEREERGLGLGEKRGRLRGVGRGEKWGKDENLGGRNGVKQQLKRGWRMKREHGFAGIVGSLS